MCRDLASVIENSDFEPDMIIAIGRGGYVPARILDVSDSGDTYAAAETLCRMRNRISDKNRRVAL